MPPTNIMNWYMSGWQGAFVSRYGYYSPAPSTAKKHMTEAEYAIWYEGKPAPGPSPTRTASDGDGRNGAGRRLIRRSA